MTSLFFRSILMAGLLAGGAALAPAQAAPTVGLMPAGPAAAAPSSLLQEVRWVQRCRPVVVHRRDRFGRPVRVERSQCRRVWVGPRRPY
ncbi:hypothetical protein [Roseomonas chloroacetimidivorans]|jgi:hypothetical protein|uniref:hypothetical protein n=1 Tax=Roseomonas chloroacetimidivorans TaxID=1766656 RepID=UPI003C748B64